MNGSYFCRTFFHIVQLFTYSNMISTRNTFQRELIVDECLRSSRPMTAREIMDKVNVYLANNQQKTISKPETIVRYIRSISERWKVEIEEIYEGRTVYYHYKDSNFSIYNSKMYKEIMEKLCRALHFIDEFAGLPHFEWLNEVRAMLYANSHEDPNKSHRIVTFHHNPGYAESLRHFTQLFDFIYSKTPMELTYRRFHCSEDTRHIVYPYHLKEYLQRWYLVGLTEKHPEDLTSFAFDRIVKIKKSDVPFIENPGFDIEEYYNAMIGLTIPKGSKPQDLLLWVDDQDYPYLKTNPIHQSQKLVREVDYGKIISLHLYVNYELEMRLLAYGERLIVLSPEDLSQRLLDRLETSVINYRKKKI